MNKKQRKLMIGSFIALGLIIIVLAIFAVQQRSLLTRYDFAYGQLKMLTGVGDYDSTHEHADFLMFVNGKQIDFTKPEYQERHSLVHMEEPDVSPYVIHKHATGITYGMFFTTIGVDLGDCLTINEKQFCDANGRLVKYYLNGKLAPNLANTEITDLDKVLILYGAETPQEVQTKLASIGNLACVQSKKC
jgi:hypothetical protein